MPPSTCTRKAGDLDLVDGDGGAGDGRGRQGRGPLVRNGDRDGLGALLIIGVRRGVDVEVVRGPDLGDRDAFFFNDTATTEIYTLSLHDALPISRRQGIAGVWLGPGSVR